MEEHNPCNDIVERNMLYIAVYPERPGHELNQAFFDSVKNALPELLPDASGWENAVQVVESGSLPDGKRLYLSANAYQQDGVCYADTRLRNDKSKQEKKAR